MLEQAIIAIIKVAVVLWAILTACAYIVWLERKLVARMQVRLGPTRVGPFGLLQPVADAIKLFTKEEIIVEQAEKWLYIAAPLIAFIPAFITFAVIPFGNTVTLFGRQIDLLISDFNVGLLYILGVTSLGVYGIVLAGWSSNSKYSLLGALRSAAQMISYEISLGLSVIGVLLLTGSLSLVDIVKAQGSIGDWFIWKQPVGFLLYLISAFAETNRTPFDLPEAETELVAGYFTEYSSMKFAMFTIAEYANMITVSALATTLFLGGWQGPFLPPVVWFMLKVMFFIFLYIWARATLPRFRYDQLMRFGWLVLLPVGLANVLVTALLVAL
ncbi:MAG TPA: NADH-quinone oxidoreductase subunit NuoH [candidate division Zixibacteria bacterium]|nr:NADH-quinone oxidoreductase subunit NuoH [candidate division Zixibacteria bacterium]